VVNDRRLLSRLTTPGALRVPEITVYFWVIKALSTALGESTSDYLVHVINPVVAVGLGFVFFVGALSLQFSVRRYIAWTYWLAVVMVGVFGTMAADVLHVGFGVPYTASTILYAVLLAAVFITWGRTEKTLSIHSIDTPRREIFYWLAVAATFAMGTALGDFTATTLHLGYLASGVLFAAVIAIPAFGYWVLRWNAIFSFWFAYVATRPLGASFADWRGKPKCVCGLGLGDGPVALALAIVIFVLVAFLAVTHRDVQGATAPGAHGRGARPAGARVPAMDASGRPYRAPRDGGDGGYAQSYRDAPRDGCPRPYPGSSAEGDARRYPGPAPEGYSRPYPGPAPEGYRRPYPGAPADGNDQPDRPPAGNPRPRPDDPTRELWRPRREDPASESPRRWPDSPR
jgi:uncharacterized membrane-anchored protein